MSNSAVELVTGYVSLVVSTKGLGKDLVQQINGVEKSLGGAGTRAGKEFTRGFSAQATGATRSAEADQKRLADAVESASKKVTAARTGEEAAARKVAIEEERLGELRVSGRAKASQLLAAEDRLLSAKQKHAIAADKVAAETRQLNAAQDEAEKQLKQTADAADEASQATLTLGQRLKAKITGFGKGAFDDLPGDAERAGEEAGERAGKGASGGILGNLKSLAGPPIIAAAAAIGGAFVAGFAGAVENQAAGSKLAAQLDLSPEESARAGRVAGSVYRDAYGESLEQVNETVRSVSTNIKDLGALSDEELSGITTKTLDIVTAFDQDASQVTRAAGQLVRTGMAKDVNEALDIITAGFQSSINPADDFLDTISEYSTQFRKIGLDGKEALGLVNQMVVAGARDSDVAADALKEFSLRTQENLYAIDKKGRITFNDYGAALVGALDLQGTDIEVMEQLDAVQAKLANGGPESRATFNQIVQGLGGIENKAFKTQSAVALFGTQAEDLGDALYSMNLETAASELGEVGGAAERMGAKLNDNAGARIEAFKRDKLAGLTDFIGNHVLPAFEDTADFLTATLGPVFDQVGVGVQGVLDLLVGGDYTSALSEAFGWEEDSEAVAFLFELRDGILGVGETINGLINGDGNGGGLSAWVNDNLIPAVTGLSTTFQSAADVVGPIIRDVIGELFRVVEENGPQFESVLTSVGEIWTTVMGLIQTRIQQVTAVVGPFWDLFGPAIVGVLGAVIGQIIGILSGAFKIIEGIFQTVIGLITGDWSLAWEGAKAVVDGIVKVITSIVTGMFNQVDALFTGLGWRKPLEEFGAWLGTSFRQFISGAASFVDARVADIRRFFDNLRAWVVGTFAAGWNGLYGENGIITRPVRLAKEFVNARIADIRGFFGGLADWVINTFRGNWSGLTKILSDPVGSAKAAIDGILGATGLRRTFTDAVTAIGRIWDGIIEKTKQPIRFIVNTVLNDGLRGAANTVARVVGLGDNWIPPIALPAGFQDGGFPVVPGRFDPAHRDNVLALTGAGVPIARVEPGEGITNREGTAASRQLITMINAGKITDSILRFLPRFQSGGFAPVPGVGRRHTGYPWATWAGDFPSGYGGQPPVRAWKDGVVALVRLLTTSYGKHIRINHTDGTSSLYAHLNRIGVQPGQTVKGGQIIGIGGWTGNVRPRGPGGAHLHFETMGGPFSVASSIVGGAVQAAARLFSGFATPVDWVKDLIEGPLGRAREVGDSPFARIMGAVPGRLADGIQTKIRDTFDRVGDLVGAAPSVTGYAAGTRSATPGWHLVGERGAELVRFKGGETVLDNRDTRAVMAAESIDWERVGRILERATNRGVAKAMSRVELRGSGWALETVGTV